MTGPRGGVLRTSTKLRNSDVDLCGCFISPLTNSTQLVKTNLLVLQYFQKNFTTDILTMACYLHPDFGTLV